MDVFAVLALGAPGPCGVCALCPVHTRLHAHGDIVLGSGYRATVDALSQERRDRLHQRLLSELRSRDITALRTDVVFGTARRPG